MAGSFVRRRRGFRMSFGRARSVQPLVHFYSKWHDAPFSVFSSIFDKSTSHCNEWCSVKVRCRYVNPATKRCARSFCIQVAHSQGHLTLGFKNSPVGRFVVLCAPILSVFILALASILHFISSRIAIQPIIISSLFMTANRIKLTHSDLKYSAMYRSH